MITIIWEYQVKVDRLEEFERIYAPDPADPVTRSPRALPYH